MSAYYNEKKFDTIEDMIVYASKHSTSPTTLEDLEIMCKQMAHTIWINLDAHDIQITNGQMRTYLERHMLTLINYLINLAIKGKS